jgi:transposase
MQGKNFVGIDTGKRMLEVVRLLENEKIQRTQFKTDLMSRMRLYGWLKKDDIVGIEAGNLAFLLVKEIKKEVGAEVIVLNPGDLRIIFDSLKKTDKNDCLNISRIIKRNPREELPEVRVPDEYEEEARRLISEEEFWTTSKTRAVNRLHSILTNSGITMITKKEIKNVKRRNEILNNLEAKIKVAAKRINSQIILAEMMLDKIEDEITERLRMKKKETEEMMSLPGIGTITALTILGYIGNGSRFSNAKQVSYYVGLDPRVDISGDTKRYGRITKRGCHQLRRVMIQCAWAMVRSPYANEFKKKFKELKIRKGSGKAIVAIARKMIELVYHLLRKGEKYEYMPDEVLKRKLALYNIC